MSKPILTISLLASRKKEQVIKCLDSLKSLRQDLDTELVIVDTSQDEEMHKLLLTYTDKVPVFSWCNDFSKARNVSLEYATGDWYLYLDDDEWVEDATALIEFFQSGTYKKYGCANYIQRNYHNLAYNQYTDCWVSRVIKRTKDTHFESSIHEYMLPQVGEGINLHMVVGHSGYIFQNEEERMKHFKRNEPLLWDMVEREPDLIRWRVQLLQEYMGVGDWDKLISCGQKGLDDFPNLASSKNQQKTEYCRDIGAFHGAIAYGLYQKEKYRELLTYISESLGDDRLQETALAYMWYLLALCFEALGSYEKVPDCVNAYFEIKKQLLTNQIRFENQQAALITGDAFSDTSEKKMLATLIGAGLHFHTCEALDLYYPQLGWDKEGLYCPDGFLQNLVHGMATIEPAEKFLAPMIDIWFNPGLHMVFYQEAAKWKEKDETGFGRIMAVLTHAQKAIAQMDVEVFLARSTLFLKYAGMDALCLVENELVTILQQESSLQDSFQLQYLLMRISVAKLDGLNYASSFEELKEWMENFIGLTLDFYRNFYGDIVANNPKELPDFVQAALCLEHGFSQENSGIEEKASAGDMTAMEAYKLAMELCPRYAKGIDYYIKEKKKTDLTRVGAKKKELRKLRKDILVQVQGLIEKKQYAPAIRVLKDSFYDSSYDDGLHDRGTLLMTKEASLLQAMCGLVETGDSLVDAMGLSVTAVDVAEDARDVSEEEKPEQIVLTIALMVSNRKDTVPRCIESLDQIRQAIPSELIVLDTGCDPDLRAYLEAKADLVQSFTWVKDFSKARNETLKYARGEWYLYLDDDEWFDDARELIEFFTSGEYKAYGRASYIQRNYLDMNGNQYSDAWVSRMAKRLPELHFESKIHEYMTPTEGNCKGLRSFVHHYGYVFETEEALRKHTDRNVSLLKEMIEEEPDNIRWRVQLIQEYRKVSDFNLLLEECLFGIEHFKDEKDINALPHVCSFYAGKITAFKEMGRYTDGILACEEAMADPRCVELLQAFVHIRYAECCYFEGRMMEKKLHEYEKKVEVKAEDWQMVIDLYNMAIDHVDKYLKWKHFFDENEPIQYLQSGTAFLAESFDDVMVKEAYSIRIICGLLQGDSSFLKEDFDKLQWTNKYVYVFEDIVEPMIEAFCCLEREEIFDQVIATMNKHEGLWEYTVAMLVEYENTGNDVHPIMEIIRDVAPDALET